MKPLRILSVSALVLALALGMLTTAGADSRRYGGDSIEVAAVWTGAEQKRFQEVLDAFTEKTGVDVTYTSTGDDISAALEPRIAGGDAPDVAMLPQPGLIQAFAQRGALTPIDDVAGPTVDKNYAPVWRELGSVDGQLYAVWFKGANKSLIWYNHNLYKDAGIEPADTFDAFMENQQTLSDFGVAPLAIGAANGWTLTDIFENIYLAQVGPEQYAALARHEIPWTDQSVKDALATMAEVVQPGHLVGGASDALQTEFPDSVQQVFGKDPDAATLIEGDFVANVVNGETDAKVGKEARVNPFPAIGGDAPVVAAGDAAVLMSDSAGGRKLIRFLATPAAAEIWASNGGFLSPNKNVDVDEYPTKTLRTIAQNLVDSENLYFDLSDLQPPAFGATDGQGEWKIFQDFLSDPSNVDGTAQQLEDAATQAFGS